MALRERVHARAREAGRHMVLPEGTESRTVQAAAIAARKGLARVTLLGEPEKVQSKAREAGVDLAGVAVEAVPREGREVEAALRAYVERVRHRGIGSDEAREQLADPLLWAALGVAARRLDGLGAGASAATGDTPRASCTRGRRSWPPTGSCRSTRLSWPRWRRARHRAARSPAGRTSSSSPIWTRGTSATSWWSGSAAPGPSGRSFRAWRARRTTSHAAARWWISWR